MRLFGRVLGALYLLDGLLAVFGGKRAVDWFNATIGRYLPKGMQQRMVHVTDVNRSAITAMGIGNVIAGAGMFLAASAGAGKQRGMLRMLG